MEKCRGWFVRCRSPWYYFEPVEFGKVLLKVCIWMKTERLGKACIFSQANVSGIGLLVMLPIGNMQIGRRAHWSRTLKNWKLIAELAKECDPVDPIDWGQRIFPKKKYPTLWQCIWQNWKIMC